MPEATYRGKPGASYSILVGRKSFAFTSGKKVPVPVSVALLLQKKIGDNNTAMFDIDGMPPLIQRPSVEAGQPVFRDVEPKQLQL